MVLDEEALEAMIRRQNDDHGEAPPPVELTDETDEFEVYERPKDPTEPEVPGPPAAPAPEPTPPASEPAPAAAPMQTAGHGSPIQEAARAAKPQVFPPLGATPTSHAPTPQAPPPAPVQETFQAAATPETHAPPMGGDGPARIAILQCDFNHQITDVMSDRAEQQAHALGCEVTHHVHVPGVYDAPLVAQHLAERDDVDCIVVLGAVVTGDTDHDQVITHATAQSLHQVALATRKPIGLGITGPGQSWVEAEARVGNAEHAVSAAVAQWRVLKAV